MNNNEDCYDVIGYAEGTLFLCYLDNNTKVMTLLQAGTLQQQLSTSYPNNLYSVEKLS